MPPKNTINYDSDFSNGGVYYAISREDWSSVKHLLFAMDVGFGVNGGTTGILKKKVEATKRVFYGQMDISDSTGKVDALFLIRASKLIKSLEEEYDKNGVEDKKLIFLFKLILYKFRQMKISIRKSYNVFNEFSKMKEVIEYENKPL